MAKNIDSIVIATDTFSALITRTNQVISAMGTEVLTANTSTDGANTTGNTNLIGIFGANTIAVGNGIRGGTVNSAANLTIASNTVFTGANAAFNSNVLITNALTTINATSLAVTGPTVNVSSNTSFSGNVFFNGTQITLSSNVVTTGSNTTMQSNTFTITSNTISVTGNNFICNSSNVVFNNNINANGGITVAGALSANGEILYSPTAKAVSISNTNIGAGVGSPINVYSWSLTGFTGAQVLARVSNTTTTRTSVVVIASNGTDSFMTEYASVHSPTSANLGIFSIATDASNTVLRFTQTSSNLRVNLLITLLA